MQKLMNVWGEHRIAHPFSLTFASLLLLISFHSDASQIYFVRMLQNTCPSGIIKVFQFFSDSISFFSIGVPLLFVIKGMCWGSRKKSQSIGLFVMLSILTAGLLSYAFKIIVQAPRPYEMDAAILKLGAGGGYSFPSGHTTEAFAAATSFYLGWNTKVLTWLFFLWASLVALSRLYLGVHAPVDVLAGLLIGTLVPVAYWHFSKPLKLLMNY